MQVGFCKRLETPARLLIVQRRVPSAKQSTILTSRPGELSRVQSLHLRDLLLCLIPACHASPYNYDEETDSRFYELAMNPPSSTRVLPFGFGGKL